eukprot:7050429-Pyramimonas_sp.AAC.1
MGGPWSGDLSLSAFLQLRGRRLPGAQALAIIPTEWALVSEPASTDNGLLEPSILDGNRVLAPITALATAEFHPAFAYLLLLGPA